MTRWLMRLLLLGGSAVALMAAGCGDDDEAEPATTEEEVAATIDAAEVESALAKDLDGEELVDPAAALLEPGGGGERLNVRSVTCPEDVPLEQDRGFSCKLDGGTLDGSIKVTQLDGGGSKLGYGAKFETASGGEIPTEILAEIKLK